MDTWGSWYFLYFCIYLQPFIIKKSKKRRKYFLGWGENWVTKQWTCRYDEILKKLFCPFFLSQIETLRRILKSSYRFVELESWEGCALLPRKAWARSKTQCGTECMVCANRTLASQSFLWPNVAQKQQKVTKETQEENQTSRPWEWGMTEQWPVWT